MARLDGIPRQCYAAARCACRELCNECHTNDNYELNNDIQPGSLVYNWEGKHAAFLKHTIGVKQVCPGATPRT